VLTDSPETRKARTAQQFTQLAPEYDVAGCFVYYGQRLVDAAGVQPGQRVLDVASGRGAVLFPAAERAGQAGHAEGIDLAEGMVQATNADAERRSLPVRVRQMDAESLDFPDASFDRVLCGFGIMFLPDQPRGLREFRRVLRPGGRLGVSTWQKTEAHDLGLVLNSCTWPFGPPPADENGGGAMLECWRSERQRSAQSGAMSPINSWTLGAPEHHRLSPRPWEHADQALQEMGTPSGRQPGRARRWKSSTSGAAESTPTRGAWSHA
jgi:ubiquinone/menaquinone biosynthesis C-methylase UbiE